MNKRPSYRELYRKCQFAVEYLDKQAISFTDESKLYGEFEDLNIIDTEELIPLIKQALEEIKKVGIVQCYAGRYPPEKSYEPFIYDCELFAFKWYSQFFGKPMYLKFALKDSEYKYVSFHRDKR